MELGALLFWALGLQVDANHRNGRGDDTTDGKALQACAVDLQIDFVQFKRCIPIFPSDLAAHVKTSNG